MQFFLTLVGIIAVATIVGYLVTPLILYLARIVAYVLAVIVVLLRAALTKRLTPKDVLNVFPQLFSEFPNYTHKPICEGDSSETRIRYRNDIPNSGKIVIVGVSENGFQNPDGKDYCPAQQNTTDMIKQPTIKKVSNIIHNVTLFYKSYYGHSTKVEKNRSGLELDIPGKQGLIGTVPPGILWSVITIQGLHLFLKIAVKAARQVAVVYVRYSI